MAGSVVTNQGNTVIAGDLEVNPSIGVPPHVTGFPPGIVTAPGAIHDADAHAAMAQADSTAVFGVLSQQNCDVIYPGDKDLILVSPLIPGEYCALGSFMLSGNLNLLGSGIWIFKSASTLITSPGSSVTGGDPCNVWWVVPSSATMDTTTAFVGNIFALTSICLKTSARLKGRTLAQTGGVTLQANSISLVCNGPTAVEISQFSAKRSDGTIVLRWIALFGGDVLGYRIYRTALTTGVSLAGLRANATSISPLISATDSGAGAYSFVNAATTSGARYAYRLVAYSPDRTVGDLALAQMGPMPTFLPLVAID